MSLAVTYSVLRTSIGRFLGYGNGTSKAWTTQQSDDIDQALDSGLRQFYFPLLTPEDGPPIRHVWSFLRPLNTLDVTSADHIYDLPENFEEFVSEGFTYASDAGHQRIQRVDDAKLRAERAKNEEAGPPTYCSIRIKDQDPGSQSRYEVEFYPKPDKAYVLSYRYLIEPEELTASNTHPYGGALHSETILQSCLSMAELQLDDDEGVHTKRFLGLLQQSIKADKDFERRVQEEELWPVANDPKSLDVDRAYLERLVGRELGYGPSAGGWSRTQAEHVNEAIRQGLRQFYSPPVLPGQRHQHEWSFLKQVGHITTVASQFEYDLPDDFGLIFGNMTFDPGTNVLYDPAEEVSEYQLRAYRAVETASGRPTQFAIRAKQSDPAEGTRFEALLWPLPDEAYKMSFRYLVNPELLLNAQYPMGGQPHAQTVLESCLYAAECLQDQNKKQHEMRFMMCLQASVSHDQKMNSPARLGVDYDRSNWMGQVTDYHDLDENLVTLNGAEVT